MTTAPLECFDCAPISRARPCVRSLACWWKEVRELEDLLGYVRSSLRARDLWDELVASEIPSPQLALYVELRCAAEAWERITNGRRTLYPSLLDRFVLTAETNGLPLPHAAILVAFRLRQRLIGMQRERIDGENGNRNGYTR